MKFQGFVVQEKAKAGSDRAGEFDERIAAVSVTVAVDKNGVADEGNVGIEIGFFGEGSKVE